MKLSARSAFLAVLVPALLLAASLSAQEKKPEEAEKPMPPQPAHVNILKESKTIEGMWTLYQKGNNLFAELSGGDYQAEHLVNIAISRGIAQGQLLGGMTWNDD